MTKEFYTATARSVREDLENMIRTIPSIQMEAQEFAEGRLSMLLQIAAKDEEISYDEYAKIGTEVSIAQRLIREAVYGVMK